MGKYREVFNGKKKMASEKTNLFSWHLAEQSVVSHIEGNCSCHNMLTLGAYFYAWPGGLASFEVSQLSLMQ